MKAWIEREYKVGGEDGEGYLTVCPAPDFPDSGILLYAQGEKNEEYYGKIYIQLGADHMRKLGEALIACANDLEKKP